MFGNLASDVRYALRLLLRQPLFTIAVVVTMAFGTGLNAGVFAVIDGLLFQPRVGRDPASFVQIELQPALVSLRDYEAYAAASSLQSLAAWTPVHAGSDLPLLVTCNFFAVYGPAQPLAGRVLRADDCGAPGASAVAVVGEDLWRTRFGADPAIVGRLLSLSGHDFTIVGVLPRGYDGQLRGPIWVPYTMASVFYDGRPIAREPATPWLIGMTGRLRPGVARSEAAAQLRLIARQQDRFVPDRETVLRVTDGSMIEGPLVRDLAVWIVPIVMGALALVLLIASMNVAVLMLSRAVSRRHEIGVRVSLGASRGRLMQMLLTESVVQAALSAPPSAYLAYMAPRAFKALVPTLPYYPFAVDRVVVGYLAAATIVAGVAAGIAPAIESLSSDAAPALRRRGSLRVAGGRWQSRDLLIGGQVALSMILLVGAALFVRAERRLVADPGYETEHVLAAFPRLSVPPHTATTVASFYRRLEEQVGAMPAVRSTAHSDTLVGDEAASARVVVFAELDGKAVSTAASDVSSAYFETIGLGIVRGSAVRDETDRAGVVVSESLARSLWPDRDPIGEDLHLGQSPTELLHVVGVARDVPSLLGAPAERTLYRLRRTHAIGDALLVRFDGDERQIASAVRDAILRLDPNAMTEPKTLGAIRRDAADRFLRLVEMVVFLGGVALLLAAVGIYGAVAFAVARRTKEIGVRIALGATPRDVAGIVLWTGWKPIAAGLAAGTIGTLVAAPSVARVFRGTPAQLDPFDAASYLAVAIVLAIAGTVAMIGPCLRANSVEPARALRSD